MTEQRSSREQATAPAGFQYQNPSTLTTCKQTPPKICCLSDCVMAMARLVIVRFSRCRWLMNAAWNCPRKRCDPPELVQHAKLLANLHSFQVVFPNYTADARMYAGANVQCSVTKSRVLLLMILLFCFSCMLLLHILTPHFIKFLHGFIL